jgi:hypothetical protein
MDVAVRDVAPDREVESARRIAFAVDRQHLAEALERHDHVGRRFRDARIDFLLRASDALVDAGGYRFAHRDQVLRAPEVAGQRHLGVVEDAVPVQQAADPSHRGVRTAGSQRRLDLCVGVRLARAGRQLDCTSSELGVGC